MYKNKKVVVVLPAYNSGRTLEKTYAEIPFEVVDEVILVDDQSKDDTVAIAKRLGITQIAIHEKNTGYGGNQKTCYRRVRNIPLTRRRTIARAHAAVRAV